MDRDEKRRDPVIIAMKGHPGTGKSTLAKAIAAALRRPLLDKDDIRDATFPLSSATPAAVLNALSYDALWRVASTQLRLGLSVVVDSPLSRRDHLDNLLRIAGGAHRVLIVECRPSDQTEWRRRLENRGSEGGGGWHKPATWKVLEHLLEGYGGCTEYDVDEVAKLVVDTTRPGGVEGLLSSVLDFIESHLGHR